MRIRPDEDGAAEISAAVSSGFFSIADNRVSILARQALLSSQIDAASAQAALDSALAAAGPGGEETADVRYYRAQLQAVSVGS